MLGFLLYIDINFYYFIYFLATSNRALLKKMAYSYVFILWISQITFKRRQF